MKAKSQSLFVKLTRAVIVIVTASCGNTNALAADRVVDEAAQSSATDSYIVVDASARRSGKLARSVMAAMHGHRGERIDRDEVAARLPADSQGLAPADPYTMPHTLFGAGSVALSALGKGAFSPDTHS